MSVHLINEDNCNSAFVTAMYLFRNVGVAQPSRNGQVDVIPEPVVTTLRRPWERVLFQRRISPFLHFFESLWMLAGRNDVDFLAQFTPRMKKFSDDNKGLNGAYGYRWRYHFKIDQLWEVVMRLRKNPYDRRCVVGMWDPWEDIVPGAGGAEKLDVPCNTQMMFAIQDGKLRTTVINRSNDVIWGALGTNCVHFSFLHEWMATAVGVEMGPLVTFSNNLHMYHDVPGYDRFKKVASGVDLYETASFHRQRLINTPQDAVVFLHQVNAFVDAPGDSVRYDYSFLNYTAGNMWWSWVNKEMHPELDDTDWGLAVRNYFGRDNYGSK